MSGRLVPFALLALGTLALPQLLSAQQVSRVSVGDRAETTGANTQPEISANGKVMVFVSFADDLVLGDTNGVSDVFARDLKTGLTTRLSVGFDGSEANGFSTQPALSANGRFVAFLSNATNLVPGDTNTANDVFLHDRKTGVTTMVSVSSDGGLGGDHCSNLAISSNGAVVAFVSRASNLVVGDTNSLEDVFVHTRKTGVTTLASVNSQGVQANQPSEEPSISGNGRYVTFTTESTNLIDPPAEASESQLGIPGDVYVRDLKTGVTQLVSVGLGGALGDGISSEPVISANGRVVAFRSDATNIVAGDTNGVSDVFVRDLKTGVTSRASVAPDGAQGDSTSSAPALSANGNMLAFVSGAANLVQGDTNATLDVFVRDLKQQETQRVSLGPEATEGDQFSAEPALSANARCVVFSSYATNLVAGDTNTTSDVFVRNLKQQQTLRASVSGPGAEGNKQSLYPSISSNGRVVVFCSSASNLVPVDTNDEGDVFVHDSKSGQTTRASVGADGVEADGGNFESVLSANARVVAFASDATNLVPTDTNGKRDVFVRDLKKGKTTRVSVSSDGGEPNDHCREPAVSANGRVIAFHSKATNLVQTDTNAVEDVFVHDLKSGLTTRVSESPTGAQGDGASSRPTCSANGRVIAFYSAASNFVAGDTNGFNDIYVRDMKTGTMTRVSVSSDGTQADGSSRSPSISANGRFVAFSSNATNLVPADTNGKRDIFVHDLKTGQTTRVSVNTDGVQSNQAASDQVISANGRMVAFATHATNLVPDDTNNRCDVFTHDRVTGITALASLGSDGAQGDNDSEGPSLSSNGRTVSFYSYAINFVPPDGNGTSDVFLRKPK